MTKDERKAKQREADRNRNNKHKISARVTDDEYRELVATAAEYHVSIASMIRIALGVETRAVHDHVVYVDQSQAATMKAQMTEIMNEMQQIRTELRRIGVNYNQMAKIRNTAVKAKRLRTEAKSSEEKKKELQPEISPRVVK